MDDLGKKPSFCVGSSIMRLISMTMYSESYKECALKTNEGLMHQPVDEGILQEERTLASKGTSAAVGLSKPLCWSAHSALFWHCRKESQRFSALNTKTFFSLPLRTDHENRQQLDFIQVYPQAFSRREKSEVHAWYPNAHCWKQNVVFEEAKLKCIWRARSKWAVHLAITSRSAVAS